MAPGHCEATSPTLHAAAPVRGPPPTAATPAGDRPSPTARPYPRCPRSTGPRCRGTTNLPLRGARRRCLRSFPTRATREGAAASFSTEREEPAMRGRRSGGEERCKRELAAEWGYFHPT